MLPTVNINLSDLVSFLPEAILIVALVLLLVLRLFTSLDRSHLGGLALVAVFVALVAAGYAWADTEKPPGDAFARMLVCDHYTMYVRLVLLGAAALTIGLTLLSGIPDTEDSADFHVLLLGGTLGMLFMASANHLLMAYIAIEMASLPSYALAGFLKGKRKGSEAALKYVVYGGGASGVMLYGISLLAGRFGTGYLPDLARGYALVLQAQPAGGVDVTLILGTLFILVGLCFKLSAVPFHFWCPDVFEGASAEVAAFLSVASKAAAFALAGRLILEVARREYVHIVLPMYFGPPLAFLGALTATFGNLAAYPQNNLKRLLAYSTIAHAGYMIMGLATVSAEGVQAVLVYLAAYVFMNLGAFAVVAFLRNRTGSEELPSYRGLVYRAPGAVVLLSIFLLSLLGLPPLAGFTAKFLVFRSVYDAGATASTGPAPWLGKVYYALLLIGGLNTVFSAFYYLRVIKTMVFEKTVEDVEGHVPAPAGVSVLAGAYLGLLALGVVALGVAWDPLAEAGNRGAKTFAQEIPAPYTGVVPALGGFSAPGVGGAKGAGGGKAKGGGKGKAPDKAKTPDKAKGGDKGGGGQPDAGSTKGGSK